MIIHGKVLMHIAIIAGIALVVTYGLKRVYMAGWNARESIALAEIAKTVRLNDEAIRNATDTFQRESWALETEIQSLDEVVRGLRNEAYTRSLPGCGITADGLRQLELLQ